MGYSASVGAMILDKMVVVNEQAEGRLDAINTVLVVAEDKITAGQEWSERHMAAVREMEVNVGGLLASTAFLRGEQDRMRREMDGLLQLNIRMHEVIMELRAAVRHGRDNPIMIDDDCQRAFYGLFQIFIIPIQTLLMFNFPTYDFTIHESHDTRTARQ